MSFTETIIAKRLAAQTQVELSSSKSGFTALVKEYVGTIEGKEQLVEDWYSYIAQLSMADSKHAEFHAELLGSLRKNPINMIDTLLSTIIIEAATAHSYIDLDVIANKIGMKVSNKAHKKDATIVLSVGLNMVSFLEYTGLLAINSIINKEKHLIYTVVVNEILLTDHIITAAEKVRAGAPMIINPVAHTVDTAGGYVLNPRTLLKTHSSAQTQSPLVCEALNTIQNVAYTLRDTLPLFDEYLNTDRFMKDDGISAMVSEQHKLIADVSQYHNKDMFFPVACDDRGRINDRSTYISYQGDKYQKAMLQFRDTETCTATGLDMLRVAIMNEIDSDKLSYTEALIRFSVLTESEIDTLALGNPITISLISDYKLALDNQEIGTITHWDATNSGLQIYSLLGADRDAAALCNVLDTGTIADAYQALADALNLITETTSFNRSNVKNAFMVFLYGAMSEMILYKINDPKNGVTAGIAEFFPSNWDKSAMWTAFTDSMKQIAPSAINLMNLIYKYNRPDQSKYRWVMPDGFKVEVTRSKLETVAGWRLDLDGTTHSGTIDTYVEQGNLYSRALAPDIIHSIDAYIVREVVRRADFDISPIHDSFGCHPNHTLALSQIVREVYADILDRDLLTHILAQLDEGLTARAVAKGFLTKGELTAEDVLNSNYIIR